MSSNTEVISDLVSTLIVPRGLTPWRPGQSGNSAGRPSYKIISDVLAAKLREADETGVTKVEKLADTMIDRAYRLGDVQAAVFVRDTTEGRPSQQIQLDANVLTETSDERKSRMLAVITALASQGQEP